MKKLICELKGASALLMNNPSSMSQSHGAPGRKRIPPPEEEAREKRYVLADGTLYLPAISVRSAILSGAKGLRIGKLSLGGILAGVITIEGQEFQLTRNGEPISGEDYEIDIRRCVVQKQGVLRARPLIPLPWEVTANFGLVEGLDIGPQHIEPALTQAGIVIGLGDYRPEKKGWFGRFEVIDVRVE